MKEGNGISSMSDSEELVKLVEEKDGIEESCDDMLVKDTSVGSVVRSSARWQSLESE